MAYTHNINNNNNNNNNNTTEGLELFTPCPGHYSDEVETYPTHSPDTVQQAKWATNGAAFHPPAHNNGPDAAMVSPLDTSFGHYPPFPANHNAMGMDDSVVGGPFLTNDMMNIGAPGVSMWASNSTTPTTTDTGEMYPPSTPMPTEYNPGSGMVNPVDPVLSPVIASPPQGKAHPSRASQKRQHSTATKSKPSSKSTGPKEDNKAKNKGTGRKKSQATAKLPQPPAAPSPAQQRRGSKDKIRSHAEPPQPKPRSKSRKVSAAVPDPEPPIDEAGHDSWDPHSDNEQDDDDSDDNTLGPDRQPRTQRERNRMAATKCRAKTKAAITQLEDDERLVSERHGNLHGQVAALREQVLFLRNQLLQHSDCNCTVIQEYLHNAARLIGETGGRHPIWGPDGTGGEWAEYMTPASTT